MEGTIIADENQLILLLKLVLKNSKWIHRALFTSSRMHILFNIHKLLLWFDCLFVESNDVLGSHCYLLWLFKFWFEQLNWWEFVWKLPCLEKVPIDWCLELEMLGVLDEDIVNLATLFTFLRLLCLFFLDRDLRFIKNINIFQIMINQISNLLLTLSRWVRNVDLLLRVLD